jgi:YidC/Oxa1 family membrane protein insertase
MMEKNRNYFIAIALSVVIVLGWQFFYMNPRIEAQRKADAALKAQQQTTQVQPGTTTPAPGVNGTTGAPVSGQAAVGTMRLDQALAKSPRVAIDTVSLLGSINLTGGRFDDLRLKSYHETVDNMSPIITLFSPAETKDGYFTELGYIGDDKSGAVPGPSTVWTAAPNAKLTDKTPVTLTYTNDKGLTFARTISVYVL